MEEEGPHEEAEVLSHHPVVVASFQGVIEVEEYHEEVSEAEVEGLSLLLLHREVPLMELSISCLFVVLSYWVETESSLCSFTRGCISVCYIYI